MWKKKNNSPFCPSAASAARGDPFPNPARIYKYSSLIVVFGLSFLILILGYFKKKKSEGLVQIDSKKINNEVSDES